MTKTKADDVIYVLRTCDKSMTSFGGFRWPESGPVEAMDWDGGRPVCGGGLHGLPCGVGNSELLSWYANVKWLVIRVRRSDGYVEFDRKCKFRRGDVVYLGDQQGATDYLGEHGGNLDVIVGATRIGRQGSVLVGGDRSILFGGNDSHLTGGNYSYLTGIDGSTLIGGDYSKLIGGEYSVLTSGHTSILSGGDSSALTSGYTSILSGGDGSVLTSGHDSRLTGGDHSILTGGAGSMLIGGYGSKLTGGNYSELRGGEDSILVGGDYSGLVGESGSILTGGEYSRLVFFFACATGRKLSVAAYVGKHGIKPGVGYCLKEGRVVPAKQGHLTCRSS